MTWRRRRVVDVSGSVQLLLDAVDRVVQRPLRIADELLRLAGGLVAYTASRSFDTSFLLPFAAGNFLYIALRLLFFFYFDLFSGWWRYVDFEDIVKIANAVVFSSLLFIACLVFIFGFGGFPRSILVIDPVLMFLSLCGIRMLFRLVRQTIEQHELKGKAKRVLGWAHAILGRVKLLDRPGIYAALGHLIDGFATLSRTWRRSSFRSPTSSPSRTFRPSSSSSRASTGRGFF